MKGYISVLFVVLSLVTVASAQKDIRFTASDTGGGRLAIDYEVLTPNIQLQAVSLKIQLGQGATVAGPQVVSTDPSFNYFPDYAYEKVTFAPPYNLGEGHLFGNPQDVGTPTFPAGEFSLVLGAFQPYTPSGSVPWNLGGSSAIDVEDLRIFSASWLNIAFPGSPPESNPADFNMDGGIDLADFTIMADGRAPTPLSGRLALIELTDGGAGFSEVLIDIDPLRGGVIGDNAYELSCNLPMMVSVIIPEPATLSLLALGGLWLRRRRC